jgi:hypothetical protein
MSSKILRLLAVGLIVGGPGLALAKPITYFFTGNFGTREQGCWMREGPDVCGRPLFGYITIDDRALEADATHAIYFGGDGPYGMFLSVGGQIGWNSEVGLQLYHNSPANGVFSVGDFVYLHTGISFISGQGDDPNPTLTFASWWAQYPDVVFNGPPRFPPMPDPSAFASVCVFAIEGCYITVGQFTVGQSTVNPQTIYGWKFFRSPFVIPIPSLEAARPAPH